MLCLLPLVAGAGYARDVLEHEMEVVGSIIQLLAAKGRGISTWLEPVLGPSSPFLAAFCSYTLLCYPPLDFDNDGIAVQGELMQLMRVVDFVANALLHLMQLQMTTAEERVMIAQRTTQGGSTGGHGRVAPLEQQLVDAVAASPCTLSFMGRCLDRFDSTADNGLVVLQRLTEGLLSKEDWVGIEEREWVLRDATLTVCAYAGTL
jgi:hypothetical protein